MLTGFFNYSLRRRLLVSATILLLVFLGMMGVGLNKAFEQSVLSNAEDALKNQVLLLIANIDIDEGRILVPEVLSEARLSQTESGLFAQINTPNDGSIWQSGSLLGAQLPQLDSVLGGFEFYQRPKVSDGLGWMQAPSLFAITFGGAWETEQGDILFSITLAERTTQYDKRLAQYQQQILIWLVVLGAALLALLLLSLSWALTPLVRVTRQVGEIEQGSRQRFDEDYPLEVSGLTQNLNQLLNFEEQRITRQRQVLGNLAHSLKTPIAVLRGVAYADSNSQVAHEQLASMQNIIDYQLQSASAVGRRRFGSPIDIRKYTQQILDSLQKLHKQKNLLTQMDIADHVVFYGDQGDWMELVGNLLDNAFKWASASVQIEVNNQRLDAHRSATCIVVKDDGAGIDQQLKTTILERGVRLDSQTPGHGLGLHIVKGIVDAYEGELSISDNSPQGTVFQVILN